MAKVEPIASKALTSESRLDRYNEVVGLANIQGVQLIRCGFDVKPIFFEDQEENDLSYSVEREASHYDEDIGIAAANIKFTVSSRKRRKKTLNCEAYYVVIYDNLKGCDRDAVDAFLRRVAPFAGYPYFRSLFANLDWAANIRLPPLPVHKEPTKSKTTDSSGPSSVRRDKVSKE